MDTREIPREQWTSFFDDFSNSYEGWIVSLEVLGSSLGAQDEASGLPLVGITADVEGRRSHVEVIVGRRMDAHVTRIIESPKRVWFKALEKRGNEAIDVESDDGTMTLLRFRHIEQAERLLPGEVERKNVSERSRATASRA